jgi:Bax protein
MKQAVAIFSFLLRAETLLGLVVGSMLFSLFAYALVQYRQQPVVEVAALDPIVVFPDFKSIEDVDVKKQMFLDFMEVFINERNSEVKENRDRLLKLSEIIGNGISLSSSEQEKLHLLASKYFLDFEDKREIEILFELLNRVDTIPVSIALAQAATESAWGTSRFAEQGINVFGQWCFEEGCGMVPNRRDEDAIHEVKSFDSIEAAVDAYFMNINTHQQYERFRDMRYRMRNQRGKIDPLVLATGLNGYSESGDHYVDQVQTIIKQNDLLDK